MLNEVNDVYGVSDYENIRSLAHKVKEGDYGAIRLAVSLMSLSVTESGCIFVPVPCHEGYATYTLKLANLLAKKTNGVVGNVLSSPPRERAYTQKINGISPSDIKLDISANIPPQYIEEFKNRKIYLVDNVVDSANTFRQSQLALKQALGIEPDILTLGLVSRPNVLTHNTTNHIYDFKDNAMKDDMAFYRQWLRKYRRRKSKL